MRYRERDGRRGEQRVRGGGLKGIVGCCFASLNTGELSYILTIQISLSQKERETKAGDKCEVLNLLHNSLLYPLSHTRTSALKQGERESGIVGLSLMMQAKIQVNRAIH